MDSMNTTTSVGMEGLCSFVVQIILVSLNMLSIGQSVPPIDTDIFVAELFKYNPRTNKITELYLFESAMKGLKGCYLPINTFYILLYDHDVGSI